MGTAQPSVFYRSPPCPALLAQRLIGVKFTDPPSLIDRFGGGIDQADVGDRSSIHRALLRRPPRSSGLSISQTKVS